MMILKSIKIIRNNILIPIRKYSNDKININELKSKKLISIELVYDKLYSILDNDDNTYGQGTNDADEETIWLLDKFNLSTLEQDKMIDYDIYKNIERIAFTRVNKKIPLAYLINESIQQGETFYIDERAIIPRSYISEIICSKKHWNINPVSNNSKFINSNDKIKSILDLCTGSGCLAILANREFSNANIIHATDLSKDALDVAMINLNKRNLNDRIHLFHGNLFNALSNPCYNNNSYINDNIKYDLIICNPPYVQSNTIHTFPREYTYEPRIAFDGGKLGYDLIERILIESIQYLNDDGGLLCEVGRAGKHLTKKYSKLFPELSIKRCLIESDKDKAIWLSTKTSNGELFYASKSALLNQFN